MRIHGIPQRVSLERVSAMSGVCRWPGLCEPGVLVIPALAGIQNVALDSRPGCHEARLCAGMTAAPVSRSSFERDESAATTGLELRGVQVPDLENIR
jgi:hypothetical protein